MKVGQKVHTINHRFGDMGVREIGHVQSNSFAFNTVKDGKTTLSWCEYPKASNFQVEDENTATIFWGEGERMEAILTYKFV